jgi:hypothetical protein
MPTRKLFRRLALAGAAVLALTGLGTPVAGADPSNSCYYFADCNAVAGHISRATVINRAMMWVNAGYKYSQTTHVNGTGENPAQSWRTDCSGMVSMAWRLHGTSPYYGLNTSSLQGVSTEIPFVSLRKGDILDDATGGDPHVIIFGGWVGGTVGGDFIILEENSYYNAVKHAASSVQYLKTRGIKGRDAGGYYIPRRYNKIPDS